MLKPAPPPYDVDTWRAQPFSERLRMVCHAWAMQGYGTPAIVYLAYAIKIAGYIGGWWFFCSLSDGYAGVANMETWAMSPMAFVKAVLWSMAYEGLGLGCGSGPLSGRYYPPIGGVLYFLRPGTTKLPLVPGLPLVGGHRRTVFDVLLYIVHYAFLVRALTAATLDVELFIPTLVLLPLLGMTDKTLFLIARAEHYFTALICFVFVDDWLAGCQAVWLAIWLWAATSKLNHHFPSVICVMTSNSPVTRFAWLRKRMYCSYPDDLTPSAWAKMMAHVGTAVEVTFPILLIVGDGGTTTWVGLGMMLGFHTYITSNIPMAVPIEWNVIMVYGGVFLFGYHGDVAFWQISAPGLIAALSVFLIAIPLIGNLVPSRVSFLSSMRYYAGNWAYSIWLFKGDCSQKLDTCLVKPAARVETQLRRFYDDDTITAVLSKVIAFRTMHLHGRALQQLLPRAVDDIDAYEWNDGELIAGEVLGWNFGDGHLHGLQLLSAVQAQCAFEAGQLRCIFVESQPMGRSTLAYTIADAATGVIDTGEVDVGPLRSLQPWPT